MLMYSDSAVEVLSILCFLLDQWIAPPKEVIKKPDVDFESLGSELKLASQ